MKLNKIVDNVVPNKTVKTISKADVVVNKEIVVVNLNFSWGWMDASF